MQLPAGVVCLDGSGEVVKSRARPFYLFFFWLGAAVTLTLVVVSGAYIYPI
jgi:hypothetical protein